MKSIAVSELNRLAKVPNELIAKGEELYTKQIEAAAERIYAEREQRPIVLVSGPSGSGKTTSAARIKAILREKGVETHTISMDDYFLPKSANIQVFDDNGNIDLESPLRLDVELFRAHLEKLNRCEEIDIPLFDFATQERREGMKLQIKRGDLVILEGIHALNPLVTGDSDSYTNRVYVSVRTRISDDSGSLLHPSKIRLMRRLLRDKLYRGRSIKETFNFFKSVERGENLYIMPFKHRADFDIDTFIEYEPLVYRDILLPDLQSAALSYDGYSDYADIEKFLSLLDGVSKTLVPENSLVREFIG